MNRRAGQQQPPGSITVAWMSNSSWSQLATSRYKVEPTGPSRYKVEPTGHQSVQGGANWPQSVQGGANWPPVGTRWSQLATSRYKVEPTGHQSVQGGANWPPVGTRWSQLAPVGTRYVHLYNDTQVTRIMKRSYFAVVIFIYTWFVLWNCYFFIQEFVRTKGHQ